jgi:aspartate aminotransferase
MSRDPILSKHFQSRRPSVIRVAQIRFAERNDDVEAVNVAIGNVSLPMHPAMQERLRLAGQPGQPFADGVVKYTATVGTTEAREAFFNVIRASGFDTSGLHAQITDGGSQAMELVVVGLCGPAGSPDRPLLLIDAAYTNYAAFAHRLGRRTVSIQRTLGSDGCFSLPPSDAIEALVERERPAAVVVIPYDNPTGHFYDRAAMAELGRLCVRHDMWMVSDEAYRELHYTGAPASSIWALDEATVPGITGRRVSIETASKVWNACGLRVGALITDNAELHRQAVAENTASLCPNTIGQHVFGALAGESPGSLGEWFARQRGYYQAMLVTLTEGMRSEVPGLIVSRPSASIYSVADVREVARPGFDALDFVLFCASRGRVEVDGRALTLLTAPMAGFYTVPEGSDNPGRTQMRIAYVEPPDRMALVPRLFGALFAEYEASR